MREAFWCHIDDSVLLGGVESFEFIEGVGLKFVPGSQNLWILITVILEQSSSLRQSSNCWFLVSEQYFVSLVSQPPRGSGLTQLRDAIWTWISGILGYNFCTTSCYIRNLRTPLDHGFQVPPQPLNEGRNCKGAMPPENLMKKCSASGFYKNDERIWKLIKLILMTKSLFSKEGWLFFNTFYVFVLTFSNLRFCVRVRVCTYHGTQKNLK